MANKSLFKKFFGRIFVTGSVAQPAIRERYSRRNGNRRRLVLESLEGRDLLAVATLGQTWKSLTLDAPIVLTGALSGRNGTHPVTGNFNGTVQISGSLAYGSMNSATGNAFVVGAVDGSINHYGRIPTASINGDTGAGGIKIASGGLTAVIPGQSPVVALALNGKINTKDLSVGGKVKIQIMDSLTLNGSGTFKGSFAPPNPAPPLDIGLNAAFDATKYGTVHVNVTCDGDIQTAPSPTTPITNVMFNWVDDAGKSVGTLKDKIPLYWNQASGSYELSQLSAPPANATLLQVSVNYQGNTKSVLVGLPSRPAISIDNVLLTPSAGATSTMVFTVSLSSPTLSNVTVKYATVDGTAVMNQDYLKKSGTLTFKPGGPLTQTISITVMDDLLPGPQDFGVQLSNAVWGFIASGYGIGTIRDPGS